MKFDMFVMANGPILGGLLRLLDLPGACGYVVVEASGSPPLLRLKRAAKDGSWIAVASTPAMVHEIGQPETLPYKAFRDAVLKRLKERRKEQPRLLDVYLESDGKGIKIDRAATVEFTAPAQLSFEPSPSMLPIANDPALPQALHHAAKHTRQDKGSFSMDAIAFYSPKKAVLRIEATDGRRLYRYEINALTGLGPGHGHALPVSAANALRRLPVVTVGSATGMLAFRGPAPLPQDEGEIQLFARTLPLDTWPPTDAVIPKRKKEGLIVDAVLLHATISALMKGAKQEDSDELQIFQSGMVRLRGKTKKIHVGWIGPVRRSALWNLVNSSYMLDLLDGIEGEVLIEGGHPRPDGALGPIAIRGRNTIRLLMPLWPPKKMTK